MICATLTYSSSLAMAILAFGCTDAPTASLTAIPEPVSACALTDSERTFRFPSESIAMNADSIVWNPTDAFPLLSRQIARSDEREMFERQLSGHRLALDWQGCGSHGI